MGGAHASCAAGVGCELVVGIATGACPRLARMAAIRAAWSWSVIFRLLFLFVLVLVLVLVLVVVVVIALT